jgi:hypothetical protein
MASMKYTDLIKVALSFQSKDGQDCIFNCHSSTMIKKYLRNIMYLSHIFFIGGRVSTIVYRRHQIIQNMYSLMFSAQKIDVGRYSHCNTQIFQLRY